MARSVQHPTLAWLVHDGLSDAEYESHLELGWLPSGGEPAVETDPSPAPAGNASRDAWAAYALTQGATDAELDGLSRNDIRDAYGD